jgi:MFS family permease
MMLVAPLSARISAARGPKTTIMLGAVVIAVGYGLGIFLMSAVWQLVLVCIVIGAGVGLAYGAMPALVMAAVPVSQTASANSFNTLMRAIGTSLASAVAGTLMAHLVTHVGDATFPSQAGLRLVLAIGGAAALTATIVAAFLHGGPRPIPSDSAH